MSRPCRQFAVLAMAVALCLMPAVASANPHLGGARASMDELDYQKALRALDLALQWGKNQPAELREIYLLLGEVHATLGQDDEAERHFRRLLAIFPDAELPAGSSPKITEPFAAAKQRMSGTALAVRCEIDAARERAQVIVDADPEALITGARVVLRGQGGAVQRVEARGQGTISLALPAAESIDTCTVIDQHGNHLVEVKPVIAAPSTALDTARDTGATPTRRSFFARWPLWGALTMAAGGAGVYFALETRSAQDDLDRINQNSSEYDFATAREVEERGQRNALFANISLGVAGACAVVTVVTLLLPPKRGPESKGGRALLITPVPLREGGGISAVFSF